MKLIDMQTAFDRLLPGLLKEKLEAEQSNFQLAENALNKCLADFSTRARKRTDRQKQLNTEIEALGGEFPAAVAQYGSDIEAIRRLKDSIQKSNIELKRSIASQLPSTNAASNPISGNPSLPKIGWFAKFLLLRAPSAFAPWIIIFFTSKPKTDQMGSDSSRSDSDLETRKKAIKEKILTEEKALKEAEKLFATHEKDMLKKLSSVGPRELRKRKAALSKERSLLLKERYSLNTAQERLAPFREKMQEVSANLLLINWFKCFCKYQGSEFNAGSFESFIINSCRATLDELKDFSDDMKSLISQTNSNNLTAAFKYHTLPHLPKNPQLETITIEKTGLNENIKHYLRISALLRGMDYKDESQMSIEFAINLLNFDRSANLNDDNIINRAAKRLYIQIHPDKTGGFNEPIVSQALGHAKNILISRNRYRNIEQEFKAYQQSAIDLLQKITDTIQPISIATINQWRLDVEELTSQNQTTKEFLEAMKNRRKFDPFSVVYNKVKASSTSLPPLLDAIQSNIRQKEAALKELYENMGICAYVLQTRLENFLINIKTQQALMDTQSTLDELKNKYQYYHHVVNDAANSAKYRKPPDIDASLDKVSRYLEEIEVRVVAATQEWEINCDQKLSILYKDVERELEAYETKEAKKTKNPEIDAAIKRLRSEIATLKANHELSSGEKYKRAVDIIDTERLKIKQRGGILSFFGTENPLAKNLENIITTTENQSTSNSRPGGGALKVRLKHNERYQQFPVGFITYTTRGLCKIFFVDCFLTNALKPFTGKEFYKNVQKLPGIAVTREIFLH